MSVEFFQSRRRKRHSAGLFAFQPEEILTSREKSSFVSRVFVILGNQQKASSRRILSMGRNRTRNKVLGFLHSPFFRLRAGLLSNSAFLLVSVVVAGLVISSIRMVNARPKKLASLPPVSFSVERDILSGQNVVLNSGESLANVLYRVVPDANGIAAAVRVLSEFLDLRYLPSGQVFEVGYAEVDGRTTLRSIVLERGRVDRILVFIDKNGRFRGQQTKNFLQTEIAEVSGIIESSLYGDGLAAGAPANKLAQLFDVFAFTIDFQRDLHPGDTFQLVYETEKDSFGEIASVGNLLAARLTAGGREHMVFHYKDKEGKVGFYSENGMGIRKALLLMPMNGGRLTSSYGMRRNPIYGYTENHPALDFAAPTGTPVMAGGDGVIIHRGWDPDGYGNYLKVRHNNGYVTLYAHMSSLTRSSVKGANVVQGQTIGYVGSTGMSTGPHLHYEIHVDGRQMNPAIVVRSMNSNRNLKEEEMAEFKQVIKPHLDKFRNENSLTKMNKNSSIPKV